ncbi:F-box protein-like protein, partial [Tanacetum coccineum]
QKLIGYIDGLFDNVISDIGLTVLAQGCLRLLKLELGGCEGSYEGIKAIEQCCQMMEELTLCDHRLEVEEEENEEAEEKAPKDETEI